MLREEKYLNIWTRKVGRTTWFMHSAFCWFLRLLFMVFRFSVCCIYEISSSATIEGLLKKLNARNFFCLVLLLCGFCMVFFIFLLIISHCVVKGSFAHTPHRKRYCCLMLMWINWVFLQCPFICLLLHHLSYSTHLFNAFVLLLLATLCCLWRN